MSDFSPFKIIAQPGYLPQTLDKTLRIVCDFPKPGVNFRDISPLLDNPWLMQQVIDDLYNHAKTMGPMKIAGLDARGFIFGTLLAQKFNMGFVMLRKPSKLPGEKCSIDYDLEYGKNTLEVQTGIFRPNERVLIVDDILATGGSALAAIALVRKAGGHPVGVVAVCDIKGLNGCDNICKKEPWVPVYTCATL